MSERERERERERKAEEEPNGYREETAWTKDREGKRREGIDGKEEERDCERG